MIIKQQNKQYFIIFASLVLLMFGSETFAAMQGGGGLPTDDWFEKIVSSITGPFAFAVSVVGMVGTGSTLIFSGGEMTAALKSLVFLVLVLSFIITAANMLQAITGTGAMIG